MLRPSTGLRPRLNGGRWRRDSRSEVCYFLRGGDCGLFLRFLPEGRQRLLERVKLVLEAADAPEQFVDFLDVVRLVDGQLEVLQRVFVRREMSELCPG